MAGAEADSLTHLAGGPPLTYRKLCLYIESETGALGGSVMWYEDGRAVETVVVGCGPFDEATDLLESLLQERRLHTQRR